MIGSSARNAWDRPHGLARRERAVTLRGKGAGMVMDGPFAETKEQLLGFYVVDCPTLEAAIATARDLRRANPTAVYEIRPDFALSPRHAAGGPSGELNKRDFHSA